MGTSGTADHEFDEKRRVNPGSAGRYERTRNGSDRRRARNGARAASARLSDCLRDSASQQALETENLVRMQTVYVSLRSRRQRRAAALGSVRAATALDRGECSIRGV